jgi:hypothetical protein
MEAVDYKYRYHFEVPKNITLEQWEEARVEVLPSLQESLEKNCKPDYSDYEEQAQHFLIEEICKKLNINSYSRWKR